ncbi:hypothetical protein BC941DRAFT_412138 [Chlamydoabsidia padenii]|nr:hypothetical protein BC941DRAFT_412138 [Chlamydoabsidia padenii]
MTKYQQLSSLEDTPIITNSNLSSTSQGHINDLEAAFNENLQEEEESTETQRLIPSPPSPIAPTLSTTPLPYSNGHSSSHPLSVSTNDGVFANMSAKPESGNDKKEEIPPSYNDAALDATPPYWQTTVITPPGMGDIILVDGLPVGSLFIFFWNLLISSMFQLIGFMVTYLLHTSHAGKNGSRAGLGLSLIQFGLYVRNRGSLDDLDDDTGNNDNQNPNLNADVVAYFLMVLGWFIIVRSVADYLKAKHMEKIISTDPLAIITRSIDNTV